jgi:ABC-type nitrate/sulfonate/bicarbonate transport system substrate-binding protein
VQPPRSSAACVPSVHPMSRRRAGLLRCLLTGLLLLAGLGRPSPSGGGDLPVVRWGTFKNYQPVFIAYDKGFFHAEGVRVELTGNFTSGPAVVQAAATGNIDAGHSAISGIINAVHAGIRVVGVADSQTEFASAPLMQWFVLKDSPIRSAADLKGKKVGVNSLSGSFYYTLLLYLERHGVAKEAVQFVVIPHNNQEQALRSRQIDVAGLIDPYSVHLRQQGGVRVLFRAIDVLGENQFSLVFFTREFMEKHPGVVRRFVKAYNRAIDFIVRHPAEASAIMARYTGVKADLNGVHRYTPGAGVRMADVQFWIDTMRRGNELRDGGKLRATDVATTEFAGKPAP